VRFPIGNLALTALGVLLMLLALACSSVTMARGGYARVLVEALAFGSLALACFAVPLVRGPAGWRVAAVILSLPVLFIASDFLRRAPYVFGG
jgi:exosortase/archaeosortase